ncbi:MAG: UvrD-helicase domain-containing protein [Planctomycetota bacterium]|jgi:ATP-dependent helicase/nuclease subunit A
MAEPRPPEPPDQEHRLRIKTDLDTTMLVEAAAGTGKTTSMVGRMVSLLAEGRCGVETMAAVTFTRKATAELRSRFQIALEQEARAAEGERGARLRTALSRIEQCFIGTIHSFCGRLLRERPIEADVDVAFEELDDLGDARLREVAWREFVARLHVAPDPRLQELTDLGIGIGALRAAYDRYALYPDVDEWPTERVALDEAAVQEARGALRAYGRHAQGLVPSLPGDPGNDKLIPFYRDLPRMIRQARLDRLPDLLEVLGVCAAVRPEGIIQKMWPEGPKQAKAERDRWREFLDQHARPIVEQWRRTRYDPVLRVLGAAVEHYDRMRSERGLLNFQDLLMTAARLLRDKPLVRRYFRRRFTHLLVDEFQDTDPIQAEVMLLLTADDPGQESWSECRPVPGSLFVVGDPKQSIYRFRRADIVTYNEVRRIVKQNGMIVPLTANFRSVEQIITWINGVSEGLFPETADDYAPQDRPMQSARPGEAVGDLCGVKRLDIPDTITRKAEVIEYEAKTIAQTIRDAIDRGLTVPRTPSELADGVKPEVTPGDFLIATLRRAPLTVYARKLQELGIPFEVTGGRAINEHEEVALLHTVLAAVVHPDDPVALVGCLRSAVFGIGDRELYQFASAGGRFDYRGSGEGRHGPIDAAFERLRRYTDWLKRIQPPVAIERIATDLGLFARAASAPGGLDQAGGLCKAIELLRANYRDAWTGAEVVAYLGDLLSEEEAEAEAHDGMPVRPHPGPAVRLMNLHGASKRDPSPTIHIDRSGDRVCGYLVILGPRQGWAPAPVLAQPADWPQWLDKEILFEQAERDRLLYVAGTRARAQLVISRPTGARVYKRSSWDELVRAVPKEDVLPKPELKPTPPVPGRMLADDERVRAVGAIERRRAACLTKTYEVHSVKAMTVHPGPGRHPAGEHGTEWGSVIHTLLEAAAGPAEDLDALARAALADVELDPARAGEAVALVQQVLASDLWARSRAGEPRLTEVPLQTLKRAEGEEPEAIIRGVIDLVFREPEGWVIVDYKTDRGPVDDLVDRYAPQVQAYAEAWSDLVGEPVREAGLFFVNSGEYRLVELASVGRAEG